MRKYITAAFVAASLLVGLGTGVAGASTPITFPSSQFNTTAPWEPCGQILQLVNQPNNCMFYFTPLVRIAGHWYPIGSSAANHAAVAAGINPLDFYQL